jgi:hypothetical protein
LTATGSELTCAYSPQPWQKKSPSGTAMAGVLASSQYARSTRERQCEWCAVSQIWRMTPGPARSASTAVAPEAISMLGEIFQPGPRSRAAAAPVPCVAAPPPPFAPFGFSGLTDLLRPSVSNDIPPHRLAYTLAPSATHQFPHGRTGQG